MKQQMSFDALLHYSQVPCKCGRPTLLLSQPVMQASLRDSWLRAWVDGLYATIKCLRRHMMELRLELALLKATCTCGSASVVLPPSPSDPPREEGV